VVGGWLSAAGCQLSVASCWLSIEGADVETTLKPPTKT
jgi:hypothetical protein